MTENHLNQFLEDIKKTGKTNDGRKKLPIHIKLTPAQLRVQQVLKP